jgi:hypothetical protein
VTVQEWITASLRTLGVIAAGEVPSSEDSIDAFEVANRLLDSWSTERLQIFKVVRTVWTIVSGTQDYTVGSGGTINIARPTIIDHVNYQRTDTSPVVEFQLNPHTEDSWASVPIKTLTAPLPTQWYYTPTFPLGTLSLWPVPTGSTLQGVLYAPMAVPEFSLITDTISLPPGYRRMLITNLALELAPEYGVQPHPMLARSAGESKMNVKRMNMRLSDLRVESGALVQGVPTYGWDIRTGP